MEDVMPLEKTISSCHFDDSDPYLMFNGPVYDSTPRNFIPFIDTIRKESEWRSLGLVPKKDKSENYKSIIKKGLHFGFCKKYRLSKIDMEAIETGKKITQNPSSVMTLILQGCNYDDFVSLPQDVVAYCECQKSINKGDLKAALNYIKKAFEAKSDEIQYANVYFEVRLNLGDKSTINEELAFFQDDIDCLVHSGRVYEWLKYLSFMKDYVSLDNTVKAIDRQLDALITGQSQNRRYSPQKVEFYTHEKEQFTKKTAHLRKQRGV
jgi:hypothetical protein